MNTLKNILLTVVCITLLTNCASRKIENLQYLDQSLTLFTSIPKLDVYHNSESKNNPVVIFIHGGYWDEGKKDIYGFLGRNFAKKEVVTVIPNYTLSPNGNYNTMAKEVAAAIMWTSENISLYNGDPNQIYLMGHSAGGHLIALTSTNPKYLGENADLVKGVILNDSAGLDMYSYLKEYPPTSFHHYTSTWTEDEGNWKDASPIYFLSENTPPFLIYVGTKTYPSILSSNKDFASELQKFQSSVNINYLDKKHVPMMRQFFYPWCKHYNEIKDFIESQN